jgi:hypothetical protein
VKYVWFTVWIIDISRILIFISSEMSIFVDQNWNTFGNYLVVSIQWATNINNKFVIVVKLDRYYYINKALRPKSLILLWNIKLETFHYLNVIGQKISKYSKLQVFAHMTYIIIRIELCRLRLHVKYNFCKAQLIFVLF